MRFQVAQQSSEYRSIPGKKYQIFKTKSGRGRKKFVSVGYAVDDLQRDQMLAEIEKEGSMALWAYCLKIHWPGYKRPAPSRHTDDEIDIEDLDGVKYLDEIF